MSVIQINLVSNKLVVDLNKRRLQKSAAEMYQYFIIFPPRVHQVDFEFQTPLGF